MSTNKPVISTGRKAAKYRGPECLNCGTPLELSDVYCSYCGQLNTTKQLSLKDFFGEFIGSVITYDSRLRYTIKDLLFKPGTITKNYAKGQRFKYANPFRFFLSVSIVYFIIQGLISTITNTSMLKVNGSSDRDTIDSILKPPDNIVALNQELLENNLEFKDDFIIVNQDTIPLTSKTETGELVYKSEEALDTLNLADQTIARFLMYRDFYEKSEIKSSSIALDSLKHNNTSFNRWMYDKNEAIDRVSENPYGFLNYLMGKIPFFLFFFTPILALFFWLIYSKKKYTYMEHIVLIFHVFSFVFLALLICLIPDTIFDNAIFAGIIFAFIGPFYFYKALRNFYNQGRLVTILKFVLLNVVFVVGATFAATIFFSITAAVY